LREAVTCGGRAVKICGKTADLKNVPVASWGRLQALVADFDRNPTDARQRIRDLLQDDREAFYGAAIRILKRQTEVRGAQFLVILLVTNGLLVRALDDPVLTREEAILLARAAQRVDSTVDAVLARAMAEGVAAREDGRATRLLAILDDISDGSRILSALARLLHHPNPRLRSKAVLMIGRGNKSVDWVRQRLADKDARIRANAAEALWDLDTAEARQLQRSMIGDPNNRVVGNAILGLYWAGDCSILPEFWRLASDQSARCRATAAWAMGETGDPRFFETLAGMLKDADPVVRRHSFLGLAKIRKASTPEPGAPVFRIAARLQDTVDADPTRNVEAAVVMPDSPQLPEIVPTQFMLLEDGHLVLDYAVVAEPQPEPLSVVFLWPRSGRAAMGWNEIALDCLVWRRTQDVWAAMPYLTDPPKTGATDANGHAAGPRFYSNLDAILYEFRRRHHSLDCTGIWHSLWRIVRPENRPPPGRLEVIAFSQAAASVAPPELEAAVRGTGIRMHAISMAPDPLLAAFCRRTGGDLAVAATLRQVRASATQAYIQLLARYAIRYVSVAARARQLTVRVHGRHGCGDTIVSLTPPCDATVAHAPEEALSGGDRLY
jgi:hypothetical protein